MNTYLNKIIRGVTKYLSVNKHDKEPPREEQMADMELPSRYPQCAFIKGKKETLGEIMLRLEALMEDNKLYLTQHINVMQIVRKLGTNRTYLSIVLAEYRGFYGYVNCKRFRYFCGLLDKYISDKAEQMQSSELSDVDERLHGKILQGMIAKSGFSDIRAFKRAVEALPDNEHVKKIRETVFI